MSAPERGAEDAMKTHPDAGGSQQEWGETSVAA